MFPRVVLEGDELVHLTWHGYVGTRAKTKCDEEFRIVDHSDSCVPMGAQVDDAPTCLRCVARRP